MKVAVLKFKNTKLLIWTLTALLVLMIGIYFGSVYQTVRNVAERQILERELSQLSSEIADLEFKSISIKNEITLSKVYEMGYLSSAQPAYVSQISSVALITPQTNR